MHLIDADALEKLITEEEIHYWHDDYSQGRFDGAQSCLDLIHDVPTIDAVPVVRCRECMHSEDGWLCDSPFHGGRTFPDDYCSNGECREEVNNGGH